MDGIDQDLWDMLQMTVIGPYWSYCVTFGGNGIRNGIRCVRACICGLHQFIFMHFCRQ